jgi:hypothetical protein
MRRTAFWSCVIAAFFSHQAAARLADVEIYDRTDGRILPLVLHGDRLYVAGEPGHEYSILVRNRTAGRVLAVTSVDGINVITGETASVDQSGYILDPWGTTNVDGWRKSLAHVARFYFTALPDSYAARTGRPDDVGVIGVALFRSRAPCCRPDGAAIERDGRRPAAAAPAAGAADARRDSAPAIQEGSRLGTGHGNSAASAAQYAAFERASARPDQMIVIYYDSYLNLQARGIVTAHPVGNDTRPDPFPAGFVPDPPS